ncbi:MAG: hypothetical protein J6C52_03430, partial [Clostridia bacterium]|nr:hypothetical protein [Clostridia bacterium]
IYKRLPLMLRIGGEAIAMDVDITKWLPGKHGEALTFAMPALAPGEYDIALSIDAPLPLYFATDAKRDGVWYTVGRMKVE